MITVARRILRLSRSKLHAKRLQIGINSTVKRPNYRNTVVTVGVFLVIWIYVSKRNLNYRYSRFFDIGFETLIELTFRNVNPNYEKNTYGYNRITVILPFYGRIYANFQPFYR